MASRLFTRPPPPVEATPASPRLSTPSWPPEPIARPSQWRAPVPFSRPPVTRPWSNWVGAQRPAPSSGANALCCHARKHSLPQPCASAPPHRRSATQSAKPVSLVTFALVLPGLTPSLPLLHSLALPVSRTRAGRTDPPGPRLGRQQPHRRHAQARPWCCSLPTHPPTPPHPPFPPRPTVSRRSRNTPRLALCPRQPSTARRSGPW